MALLLTIVVAVSQRVLDGDFGFAVVANFFRISLYDRSNDCITLSCTTLTWCKRLLVYQRVQGLLLTSELNSCSHVSLKNEKVT